MSMSKMHYEALADAFKHRLNIVELHNPVSTKTTQRLQRDILHRLACDVADVCKRDNPRFQHSKFLRACGLEE